MLKDLDGTASRTVTASAAECFELLAAVDRYPDWYPAAIREIDVLERHASGRPWRVRAKLHLSWGPVVKDFDLVLAIEVKPSATVRLARISDQPSVNKFDVPSVNKFDVTWHVQEDGATQIDLELRATLDVPRFLPLAGIGNGIAGGFVDAAARRLPAA